MAKQKQAQVLPVEYRVASPERVTIGGIEAMAHPLSIQDLGTIRHEARQQGRQKEQEEAREKLKFLREVGEDTPEAKREILLYHNLRQDSGASSAAWMMDFDGTAFSVWLMVRKDKPDITLEQVRLGILHFNIDYWQNLVDRLSYPPTPEDDTTDDKEEGKTDPNAKTPRPNPDAGETTATTK